MTPKHRLSVLAGVFLALTLAGLASRLEAYPEPAPFPIAWQFAFTHEKPAPISVKGDDGQYHWYWYMPYKVVNTTGADRLFIPEVTLATDEGDLVTAGKNVPPSVYPAIKAALGNPLLVSPTQVVGTLLQGKDYAKESVAIWPDFGHDIDHLSIFVAGLSGETATAQEVPGTQPATESETRPATKPLVFRKTLMITYTLPGTTSPGPETTLRATGDSWVMR